jgi:hypothetical protein
MEHEPLFPQYSLDQLANACNELFQPNLGKEFRPAFCTAQSYTLLRIRQTQASKLTIVDNQILHDYILKQ